MFWCKISSSIGNNHIIFGTYCGPEEQCSYCNAMDLLLNNCANHLEFLARWLVPGGFVPFLYQRPIPRKGLTAIGRSKCFFYFVYDFSGVYPAFCFLFSILDIDSLRVVYLCSLSTICPPTKVFHKRMGSREMFGGNLKFKSMSSGVHWEKKPVSRIDIC